MLHLGWMSYHHNVNLHSQNIIYSINRVFPLLNDDCEAEKLQRLLNLFSANSKESFVLVLFSKRFAIVISVTGNFFYGRLLLNEQLFQN